MSHLPRVSGERVVKALRQTGFQEIRQRGSHVGLNTRLVE